MIATTGIDTGVSSTPYTIVIMSGVLSTGGASIALIDGSGGPVT